MVDLPTSRANASPFSAGDVIDDKFVLERRLGQGGLADIWAAVVRETIDSPDKKIAVRLPYGDIAMHPEIRQIFEDQFEVEQALAGPNLGTARTVGFDTARGVPYLTMRFMKGHSLAEILKSRRIEEWPLDLVFKITYEIGTALEHVHDKGFVHSDVKPAKLFIQNDGKVILFNFALARRYRWDSGERKFDPGQLGALTPTYASVEVFEGEDPDPKDDIYSFGVVLYQLFSGRHPYDRKSAPKAEELGLKPPPIDRLTRRQNRVIRDALRLRREQRSPSALRVAAQVCRPRTILERIIG